MNPAPPVTRIFITVSSPYSATRRHRNGVSHSSGCHDSEHSHFDRVCAHPRLADVLCQRMHDGLVQVLDDAIIRAVDMDADLGGAPGGAPVEAGDCNGSQAMVAGPG